MKSDPSHSERPANRLKREASPYLRQHAHNPVDWHPWGAEAFEKARREDKPVFLSVGYSACHWCHVMAHESFEDDEVAAALNRDFVCVKVDREERPDVDDLYMKATQLMTRRGGWPNSVWLLPDGRPWYAGTYFPRDDRPPAIGFLTLLGRLAGLWRERRADVTEQAARLHDAIRRMSGAGPSGGGAGTAVAPGPDAIRRAEREWRLAFDDEHGGFGEAPKFPPCGELSLLLELERRAPDPDRRRMIRTTLDAMALGGMRDHVGGGFHRYSTDERWLRPHFEKMLYDNARLARVYADAAALWDDAFYAGAARGALDWALREMASPEGGFRSALDADSGGGEGRFYVWTLSDLRSVLGPDPADGFARLYRCREAGNYEDEATGRCDGTNIPHLEARPEGDGDAARRADLETLRLAREGRPHPGLDDKILASWNGLTIGSLAHAGRVFGEPRYVEAARRAADHLWTALHRDGRLLHQVAGGRASLNGYLDDYTALACGFLDLHEATGGSAWAERAGALIVSAWDHFRDAERGGFFFTSDDHETLIDRSRDDFDGATPSGSGLAALAMVRLYRLTRSDLYRVMAEETLLAAADLAERAPRGVPTMLLALAHALEAGVFGAAAAAGRDAAPVDVAWRGRTVVAEAGREFGAVLSVRVAEGWHIEARGADGSPGLRVGMDPHPSIRLAAAGMPSARMGSGSHEVDVRFAADPGTPPGLHDLRLTVEIRPCTETECAPDVLRELSLNVRVGPAAEDEEEECGGG